MLQRTRQRFSRRTVREELLFSRWSRQGRIWGTGVRLCSHFWKDSGLSPEGFPSNRFSTLMSSSKSGQWIPSLFPIRRQLFRSSGVPCSSRGYQARGTEIARPSFNWRVRLSSVITTCCAIVMLTPVVTSITALSVNFSAVGNRNNCHSSILIINLVKDSIIADSDSPFRAVHKFCCAGRAWVI